MKHASPTAGRSGINFKTSVTPVAYRSDPTADSRGICISKSADIGRAQVTARVIEREGWRRSLLYLAAASTAGSLLASTTYLPVRLGGPAARRPLADSDAEAAKEMPLDGGATQNEKAVAEEAATAEEERQAPAALPMAQLVRHAAFAVMATVSGQRACGSRRSLCVACAGSGGGMG
jgi:hypothetical protein